MKNVQQENCTKTETIEADYINSMLGLDSEVPQMIADVIEEHIDFNAVLKQTEFESNIFDVQGLKIAVPETSIQLTLDQQQVLNENIHLQDTAYIGKFNHEGQAIEIIDLAHLAMNNADNFSQKDRDQSKTINLVILKGSRYGFIYDQITENQMINKQQVCWRDADSKRLWLAGTIAEKGLCLLDIEGLIKLLNQPVTAEHN